MRKLLTWIPFVGAFFINQRRSTVWESLQWIYQIIWFLLALLGQAKAQTFTEVGGVPFVATDIDYDGQGNRWITQQQGKVLKNGEVFMTLPVQFSNECGLVGLDMDGRYGYLHISGQDSKQRVIRFDTQTLQMDTLVTVDYQGTIHRGGDIKVVGKLVYATFGYGIFPNASQDTSNLRGKLVEIEPITGNIRLMAIGLRNPFRFDILGKDLYIGDVGADTIEEANYFNLEIDSLENYGWPCFEGTYEHLDTCEWAVAFPIYQYSHSGPQSITGGVFHSGYWYWTDHFSGIGGKVDSMGFNTPVVGWPQYVTGMTVNPFGCIEFVTWIGGIWTLCEAPLSIDKEKVGYERPIPTWDPTQGPRYFDMLGRFTDRPEYGILYYDRFLRKLALSIRP